MLDHAFLAAIDVLRSSLNSAMLDGQVGDERLQSDLMGGDLTWEASYALPGEAKPARVRADVTLDWPTWSQTAYRSWQLDGELEEPPELGIEIVLRLQLLAGLPDLGVISAVLDDEGPDLGHDRLRRASPMVEQTFDDELDSTGWAVEFAYDGTYELTEGVLADLAGLQAVLGGFGPWLASLLVRLGDLQLAFIPPEDREA